MAKVNMNSIYKKCENYSKTPAGKEKMKRAIKEKIKNGDNKTGCGDELLTFSKMGELAEELIYIMKSTAASYNLAPSVMSHFDSLTYMVEDVGSGQYKCYIYFSDNLGRESLDTDYKKGEGIDNIVALFNNGYTASAPKAGYWRGHDPLTKAAGRQGEKSGGDAYVLGVQSRPSLQFMQTAINDFASKYQAKFNISVMLNEDEYDGGL